MDNAGKKITVLFLLGMTGCANGGLDRSPEVDTNGTLRLYVVIANADPAGPSPGTAVTVGVRDTTGAFVSGAAVRVEQAGSIAELPELQPPYNGVYQATLPAFAEDWEVSVVRGVDHVRDLHLVGPSASSVSVVDGAEGILVEWAPAHQEGVTSQADLTRLEPPPPPYSGPLGLGVSSSSDEGSAGPFRLPRIGGDAYDITLTRSRKYDGVWGTASVSVMRRAVLQGQ